MYVCTCRLLWSFHWRPAAIRELYGWETGIIAPKYWVVGFGIWLMEDEGWINWTWIARGGMGNRRWKENRKKSKGEQGEMWQWSLVYQMWVSTPRKASACPSHLQIVTARAWMNWIGLHRLLLGKWQQHPCISSLLDAIFDSYYSQGIFDVVGLPQHTPA